MKTETIIPDQEEIDRRKLAFAKERIKRKQSVLLKRYHSISIKML